MRHLRRLRKAATATALGAGIACSAHADDGQSGTTPPVGDGLSSIPAPDHTDPGYGVVDYLPSPATCDELAASSIYDGIYLEATWAEVDKKMRLQCMLVPRDGGRVEFEPPIKVDGGTLVTDAKGKTQELRFEILPAPGAKQIEISLLCECDKLSQVGRFKIALKGSPKDGETLDYETAPVEPVAAKPKKTP